MARNISRQIEDGHSILRENQRFDLTFSEIRELMSGTELSYDGMVRLIDKAFSFGVAIGKRISE